MNERLGRAFSSLEHLRLEMVDGLKQMHDTMHLADLQMMQVLVAVVVLSDPPLVG
jgi:hypothetical protein